MKYQVVLQFSVTDKTDFDELIDVEGRLILVLGSSHIVDGHDFGSGEMNIFVHTNDPQAAFDLSEPAIPPALKPTLRAAFRKFSEDGYHWIYPQFSDSEFKIV